MLCAIRPNGADVSLALVIPKSDDLSENSLGVSASLMDDLPYEDMDDLEDCAVLVEDDSTYIERFLNLSVPSRSSTRWRATSAARPTTWSHALPAPTRSTGGSWAVAHLGACSTR